MTSPKFTVDYGKLLLQYTVTPNLVLIQLDLLSRLTISYIKVQCAKNCESNVWKDELLIAFLITEDTNSFMNNTD